MKTTAAALVRPLSRLKAMYPSPTYGRKVSEVGVQELPEDDADADDEDHHLQRQPPRAEHGPPVAILHVLDREIAPAPPASETLSDVADGRLELHAASASSGA